MNSTMAIHVSSSGAANASQTSSLPSIRNPISTLQEMAVRPSQDLPEFFSNYFATSHQLFPSLKDFLNGANFDPSLDQGEGFSGAREILPTFEKFLAQAERKLACAYVGQLGIQTEQHLHGERLDKKLGRIKRWRKVSTFFFLGGAAISAAAAVVAVNVKPGRLPEAAAAASASVLFIGVGKWADSYLEEREKAVNKHRGIITAMMNAGRIGIINLSTIYGSVGNLQSETASILTLVDNDDDEKVEVEFRAKMVALEQRFRELQREVNRCSSAVSIAGETVLQSIITNLDRSS